MPLLYESSDDSGQVVINGASQGAVISTGQKVSPARKASANFAKLNRRNIVFKDESAQRLRKINGNDTMADLVPVHSSVGRSARRGRGLKRWAFDPRERKDPASAGQVCHAHLRASACSGPPSKRNTR